MMIPQAGQLDGEIMADVMAEAAGLVEELTTVKRFTGVTGGDPAAGKGATPTYDTYNTTALIVGLSAQEINYPGSIYAAGDLRGQFQIEIFGGEGAAGGDAQAAGRRSDIIVFRGREYRIIGHVDRVHFGGIYYWSAVMRQAKSS